MVHAEAIADYDETVRPTARAARAAERASRPATRCAPPGRSSAPSSADDPPFRLPLGGDAVDMIRAALERQRAEIDAWEDVSRDVEFDDPAATER